MSNDVFILSAVRTAIGTFGGSLKDHSPTKLSAIVVKEAIRRANLACPQRCRGRSGSR